MLSIISLRIHAVLVGTKVCILSSDFGSLPCVSWRESGHPQKQIKLHSKQPPRIASMLRYAGARFELETRSRMLSNECQPVRPHHTCSLEMVVSFPDIRYEATILVVLCVSACERLLHCVFAPFRQLRNFLCCSFHSCFVTSKAKAHAAGWTHAQERPISCTNEVSVDSSAGTHPATAENAGTVCAVDQPLPERFLCR